MNSDWSVVIASVDSAWIIAALGVCSLIPALVVASSS
ncbi:MAG: hypothetical protein JWP01_1631 [Myxococcales bacterium]|nr:hypothetical protein [Myxococcales bacterium]